MLRVVCDTNVLISGITGDSGCPYEIIEAWKEGKIILLVSQAIIAETVRVLGRPFFRDKRGISQEDIAEVRSLLETEAILVSPRSNPQAVPQDPADNQILACALEGGADYLISGDHHLLELREYEHLAIVTAREFLEILWQS